jgi:hypothetical protein
MSEAPMSPQPKEVREVLDGLRAVVARLDPLDVPLSWAPGLWADLDRIERLAAGAKTLLAARVEESEVWRREGYRSSADYMAAIAGSSVTGARGQLASSKRLAELPSTAAAVRAGDLSSAQTESIADAAKANPDVESRLLGLAAEGASLAELREECGRAKAAADPDSNATHERIRRERRLRQGRDAEGAWCLHGRGTVDDSAEFNAALDEIIDELFTQARERGEQVTREQLAYDALVEMARRQLATDWADDVDGASNGADPGDPNPGDPVADAANRSDASCDDTARAADQDGVIDRTDGHGARRKRRRRRTQQTNYLGLLRIDVAALQRGAVEGEELCEISGVGPVPVRRMRELVGDAALKLVLTKGVDVVSVTHLGRSPNIAQRIALAWTMPCCSVLGCARTWIEYDHRKDWAKCHVTRIDQLDPLCPHHHALKTRHNWALIDGTGKRVMVGPDDPRHPSNTNKSNHDDSNSSGSAAPDSSGPPGTPVAADMLLDNRIETSAA